MVPAVGQPFLPPVSPVATGHQQGHGLVREHPVRTR
jgi:hypothetical protein